jgi:hypothetical protein
MPAELYEITRDEISKRKKSKNREEDTTGNLPNKLLTGLEYEFRQWGTAVLDGKSYCSGYFTKKRA